MASSSQTWVVKKRIKDNGKSPRVSVKAVASQHLCLCGGRAHAARHHSCKMSSGASSNSKRLTLIHKQLPLVLCRCRFRTAVPPNISLPCLANIEKKKAARQPSLLKYITKGWKNDRAKKKPGRSSEKKTKGKKEEQRTIRTCNIQSFMWMKWQGGIPMFLWMEARPFCLCKAIPWDGMVLSNEQPAGWLIQGRLAE